MTCALTAPPASSGPGPGGLGDPVFPTLGNTGYDVRRYDLEFAYRPDTRLVDGVTTIEATADRRLDAISLDALGPDVRGVTVDGRPATFEQAGEKLVITPARRIPARARIRMRIEYTVDPRARIAHTGWVPTPDGFAVAGQPDGAHTVFPCNDHPGDKADFGFRVTVPDGSLGVASGTRTGVESAAGTTTYSYHSRDPIATELVQIAVGDYRVLSRSGPHDLPLRDVVPSARAEGLAPALALTPGQLSWAEARLGRFPFETYGLLPANTDDPNAFGFTGLETQTLTLYKPGFLLQPEDRIGSHMMHELVHSWFGNSVSPRVWSDLWLNEGHADLYALLYRYERGWPDSLGLTTLEARMRATYALGDLWRRTSGPVAAPNAANLFDSQRYTGAALVLYALRQEVGEAAFARIERDFLARHRHGAATTRDYVDTASRVAGRDLSGFLGAWLYDTRTPPMPGHPDWVVDPLPAEAAEATTRHRGAERAEHEAGS
ncbi:M1 family metallopeptidase [Embleya sp. NBC_00896]|nr:M1 family metallopeptidase [Embleya sp. NBC_00896]